MPILYRPELSGACRASGKTDNQLSKKKEFCDDRKEAINQEGYPKEEFDGREIEIGSNCSTETEVHCQGFNNANLDRCRERRFSFTVTPKIGGTTDSDCKVSKRGFLWQNLCRRRL